MELESLKMGLENEKIEGAGTGVKEQKKSLKLHDLGLLDLGMIIEHSTILLGWEHLIFSEFFQLHWAKSHKYAKILLSACRLTSGRAAHAYV